MKAHSYFLITSIFFALVAIGHLLRVIGGWSFTFGDFAVPLFGSVLAAVVTGALSVWGLKLSRSATA